MQETLQTSPVFTTVQKTFIQQNLGLTTCVKLSKAYIWKMAWVMNLKWIPASHIWNLSHLQTVQMVVLEMVSGNWHFDDMMLRRFLSFSLLAGVKRELIWRWDGLPEIHSKAFITRSFPTNVCRNEWLNSFPFVRKYQLEIMRKWPENKSRPSDCLIQGQS